MSVSSSGGPQHQPVVFKVEVVGVAPAHPGEQGPGRLRTLLELRHRQAYCASLVVEASMRVMLALRPARLSVPMLDRKAVVLRSELGAKKK